METYTQLEILNVITSYIDNKRENTVRDILNVKTQNLETDFIDLIEIYAPNYKMELLEYFFKNC